jgi:hypothetical protein
LDGVWLSSLDSVGSIPDSSLDSVGSIVIGVFVGLVGIVVIGLVIGRCGCSLVSLSSGQNFPGLYLAIVEN